MILTNNLKSGLFTNLELERKVEVSNLVLDIGSRDVDTVRVQS